MTDFQNGIPIKQVRDLSIEEAKWEFWTASQFLFQTKPEPWWVASIPKDETWVVERFGKVKRSEWKIPFSSACS